MLVIKSVNQDWGYNLKSKIIPDKYLLHNE